MVYNTAVHLLGPYRIDALAINARIAATNKVPNAPYRGAGRPEAAFAMERVMDLIAATLGREPADVRLAKFGGLTPSVYLAKQFADGWSADIGMSFYRQKSSWHLGGDGTPGILDFSARWLELGVQKAF